MARGSCLCGAIRFEFDDAGIVQSLGCYCTNCRKISGSEFGVYLQVGRASFRWLAGESSVAAYESSPGNERGFCGVCGSVAPITTSYGAVRVPAGALDDDPGVAPDVFLFGASKASWCAADPTARVFSDAGPPEFWNDVVRRLSGRG